MVLVEVYVPAVDKTWDFQLDENARVTWIIDEIAEVLQKTLRIQEKESEKSWALCDMDEKAILPGNISLADCGVRNGSRLMFV